MNPSEISALAARAALDHVWRKVEAGDRLSVDDATALLSSDDILALGAMADFARARIAGDEVYFISNRHINHTNVCRNRCLFCAFSHDEGDADAYTLSVDEVVEKARETLAVGGISEIHIVGGEHPDLPFDYYLDMMRALRELAPDVHIQAFTASEIGHFARISDQTVPEVLQQLKDAGLGSLPGGGRRGVQRPRARHDLRAQDQRPDVARRAPRRARGRHGVQRDHALRARGEAGGARGPHGPPARAPGRHRRLQRLHPAVVPAGQHRPQRAAGPDRLRRPQDARGRPSRARQLHARQGVLDQRGAQAGAGLAGVRRQRPRRHRGGGEDQPRGRRRHGPGAQQGRAGPRDQGRRPRPGRARHALQRRAAVR